MKPIRIALLLAATVFTQIAAHAGEMTLFSRDNFGGREVTLRDVTPNLTDIGFNDRGSSMVVRSGTWEVCVDADFRGTCAVFERGEYPNLARFNDQISSVREVGHTGRGPDHEWHGRRGMIELFSQRGLNGNSTRLVRERDDFNEIGFNDRTASVNVEDGVWQLCSDAQFRGTCRVFGPGRYDDLGAGLTGQVSSARLVDERAPARPEPAPTAPPQFNAPVVMFSEEGLRGRPVPLRGDTPDFVTLGANDRFASILVQSGTWQFCSDSYFRGQCRIMGPGEYPRLHPELVRSISSMRQVAAANSGRDPVVRDPVELFATAEFGGRRLPLRRDENSLTDFDFNDQTGSIVVNEGEWQFCVHANYGGQCVVYGPGRYPHLGPLNNQLSSVRRVR